MSEPQLEAPRIDGPDLSELGGKYLTFVLDQQEYGIEIIKVREIIGVLDITPVPQTSDFVLGVINLRGKVIPVLDLRLRFGLIYRQPDARTCIVVVASHNDAGQTVLMGLVVDQVSEVVNVTVDDVDPTPDFGVNLDVGSILGIAKVAGGVKILLDIDQVITGSELVMGV
jgi:purine-binding chemotaxis protein CheW